ncbi:hypothetical protein CBM20_01850 [Listeria monocytogenes]|nr:hypothetical protein [Listeria monocytogenes]
MSYYVSRLRSDKLFLISVLLLVVFINIDLYVLIVQKSNYSAMLSTFLTGNSLGHYAQMLVLWIAPVYVLLGPASWYSNDYKCGNDKVLITRYGKKKYVQSNLLMTFISSAVTMILLLTSNLISAMILFSQNKLTPFGSNPAEFMEYGIDDLTLQLNHQVVTNIVYIVVFSFIYGLLNVLFLSMSFIFIKKSITFFGAMAVWFLCTTGDYAITLAFQPFTEYSMEFQGYIVGAFFILVSCICGCLYLYKVKSDEL